MVPPTTAQNRRPRPSSPVIRKIQNGTRRMPASTAVTGDATHFIRTNGIVADLGLRLSFINVDPAKGKFTFGVSTTQKDYIILKATEKPFINLLWSGTLLMALGFGMAIVKHRRDNRRSPQAAASAAKQGTARRQPQAAV